MLRTKLILQIILNVGILFFPSLNVIAQTDEQAMVRKWSAHAGSVQSAVVDDAKSLDSSEKALYFSFLAKLAWEFDNRSALEYFGIAGNQAIASLESDEKLSFSRRLKNSERALQTLVGLDSVKSEKFIAEFISKAESVLKDKTHTADLYVQLGLLVADENPDAALKAGLKSLQYGKSLELFRLIGELRAKDNKKSDDLLFAAMKSINAIEQLRVLATLAFVATRSYKGRTAPEATQRAFLAQIADITSSLSSDLTNLAVNCQILTVTEPLAEIMTQLLPERSETFKAQMKLCRDVSPKPDGIETQNDQNTKLKSVEDFLRAGRQAKNPIQKGKLFYSAIVVLTQKKEFDVMISVLDGFTESEVSAIGRQIWDSWRTEAVVNVAISSLAENDTAAYYRAIENAPARLRPDSMLGVLYKIDRKNYEQLSVELFNRIIKELNASLEISTPEKATISLTLLGLSQSVQSTDVFPIFRSAVRLINQADKENLDHNPDLDIWPLTEFLRLPSQLVAEDEAGTLDLIRGMSERRTRIRMLLGLFESTLKSYQAEKKKLDGVKPTARKGER